MDVQIDKNTREIRMNDKLMFDKLNELHQNLQEMKIKILPNKNQQIVIEDINLQ